MAREAEPSRGQEGVGSGGSEPGGTESGGTESDGSAGSGPVTEAGAARRVTRRGILAGTVGAIGGGAIGAGAAFAAMHRGDAATSAETPEKRGPEAQASPRTVAVHGIHQAGIARPETPQRFGLIAIGDIPDPADVGFLPTLGTELASIIASPPPAILPDGPGSLTVTFGVGPRVVTARRPGAPGSAPLPTFAHDGSVDESATGGDLLVAAYSDDPTVLPGVVAHLTALVPGYRTRWQQHCFRAPGTGTIARNPLGFLDNIQVPHGTSELNENVWLDDEFAGGSICVIRRLRLDTAGFRGLTVPEREDVIGRRLDGSPLSGGRPFAQVNVDAKTATGAYRIPLHAHVRAAHPSFTGSHLMLRRGYAYDNGGDDAGLMFICFQRDLRTFVATQSRLDDLDHLMHFVTPTGSATFLVLPGYTAKTPIGRSFL